MLGIRWNLTERFHLWQVKSFFPEKSRFCHFVLSRGGSRGFIVNYFIVKGVLLVCMLSFGLYCKLIPYHIMVCWCILRALYAWIFMHVMHDVFSFWIPFITNFKKLQENNIRVLDLTRPVSINVSYFWPQK